MMNSQEPKIVSPSREEINRHINQLLESPAFEATPNQKALLKFVVEQTLTGNVHRIKAYTVATEVFGRTSDFNQSVDPIVSIQASRLRRALEQYYESQEKYGGIRIDIPKGGYVPVFHLQKNLKPERTFQLDARGDPGIKGDLPIMLVLPFQDLTDDPDQHYFSIGLVEDLVTELSRFQYIVAISRQHVPINAELPVDSTQWEKIIGAHFVLGGIIRKDQGTVKVSVHLTDARNGRQVWADAYKTPLEASRLISSQEEIAQNVVAAIASEYGVIARRLSAESVQKTPAMLSTYEAMLRYYAHMVTQSPHEFEASYLALRQAVKREPGYGPANSALADFYCDAYAFDIHGFEKPLDNALRYARQGVSLEPGLQFSRTILAYALCLYGNRAEFEKEIDAALALNSKSMLTMGYAACCYTFFGEFERGRFMMDWALESNPYHPSWFHLVYYFDHFRKGMYDRALIDFEKYKVNETFWVQVLGIAVLGKLDRAFDAQPYIEEIKQLKPDFASRVHELIRRPIKVDSLADDLIDGLCKAGMAINFACH